jgi:hypothetical protein
MLDATQRKRRRGPMGAPLPQKYKRERERER